MFSCLNPVRTRFFFIFVALSPNLVCTPEARKFFKKFEQNLHTYLKYNAGISRDFY